MMPGGGAGGLLGIRLLVTTVYLFDSEGYHDAMTTITMRNSEIWLRLRLRR